MLAYRTEPWLVNNKLLLRGTPGSSESLQKELSAGSQLTAFKGHPSSLESHQ